MGRWLKPTASTLSMSETEIVVITIKEQTEEEGDLKYKKRLLKQRRVVRDKGSQKHNERDKIYEWKGLGVDDSIEEILLLKTQKNILIYQKQWMER